MNMKRTIYLVNYTYNNGTLGTDRRFNTDAEARAFEEQYKRYFNDGEKSFRTLKITKTFFKSTVECIREWYNN